MIVGLDKFSQVDIRVRVSGGGHTSQVYAVRQAIAKALIAYYQKYVDERKLFGYGCGKGCGTNDKNALLTWRVFPENRQQEPAQAGPRTIRPHPASCRQPAKRAQEVWWSGCPREVPEVLPLKLSDIIDLGLVSVSVSVPVSVSASVWGRRKRGRRSDGDCDCSMVRIVPSFSVATRVRNGKYGGRTSGVKKESFARAVLGAFDYQCIYTYVPARSGRSGCRELGE